MWRSRGRPSTLLGSGRTCHGGSGLDPPDHLLSGTWRWRGRGGRDGLIYQGSGSLVSMSCSRWNRRIPTRTGLCRPFGAVGLLWAWLTNGGKEGLLYMILLMDHGLRVGLLVVVLMITLVSLMYYYVL